jgi:predicted nucleic acid-binding protein
MVYTALLDTSVVIDLEHIGDERITAALGGDIGELQPAISAVTLAELAAGPHATEDPAERAVRQTRLQWAESVFEPLPFDDDAARCYGVVYALVRAHGRKPRGRLADLMIASIALANGLTLLTRNPKDFTGLDTRVQVAAV